MNVMKNIRIEKITLNVGAGKDEEKLRRGMKLLHNISGVEPMKTITSKRIPTWSLRPGLAIGCKITLRGKKAEELLRRLLAAVNNKLKPTQFDAHGNFSFGIREYVDVPGVEYDPEIKIMGFEVAITLIRPGYHIKKRRIQQKKVSPGHQIKVEEARAFLTQQFGVTYAEAS
ncbi:50S ribosomal protein L5 [Candidatus Woesearchaeota archaeon]|nr:50S ribosomal protein L5 [Candidatus Woesearchaeota archaeon]